MANTVGLDYLPVELIYRILDCLDIQTIFHSLHGVCRRINHTLGTYDRYKFNFQSISKHDFHLVCRLIPHNQVVALTLSDGDNTPGQISLFLSSFTIKEFVRLSSLTLYEIDETDLQKILKTISLKSLKYLSVDCRRTCGTETHRLLRSSLVEHSLQKLSLGSSSLCKILTDNNTANIKHLVLNACMIRQVEQILSSSLSLETLNLTHVKIDDEDDLQNFGSSPKSSKLAYLSISSSYLTMDMIVSFFNWLIPNLKQLQHLRVISDKDDEAYFDGARWESLLLTTSLTQFQFHFHARLTADQPINEILLPFRSHFWLNEKRWFVACDKHRLRQQSVLYSIPWCDEQVIWQPLTSFESENTLPNNEYSIFNEVNHLHIELNCPVLKSDLLPYHHFPCVSSLTIGSMPTPNILSPLKLISSLNVILPQLVSIVLSAYIDQARSRLSIIFKYTPSLRNLTTRSYPVLNHMKSINNREMMSRIRSLELHEELYEKSDVIWLCEAFQHVERLCVSVSSVQHMRTICSRLQFSLTTVHFRCLSIAHTKVKLEKTKVSLLNWLHNEQWHFTFNSENESISFWLSNRQKKGWWDKKRRFSLPSNEQKPKRIKSTNSSINKNNQDD